MHRLLNSKVKAQHFAHFCSTRLELSVLSVNTLATIILSLQKYAAEPDVVACIRDCFYAKRNMACLQLKNKVDTKFPMFDLIYHRIRSQSEREAILKHFEAEAAALSNSPNFSAPIKLLCGYEHEDSDDDDELETGSSGGSKKLKDVQRVAFLTARPEFLRKRSNFVRFKRVFAEHRFVFVGDNGQGDIDLGKELLKDPHLYAVSAVLIHDVIRNHATSKPLNQHSYRGKECNQSGIHSFRTYIEEESRSRNSRRCGCCG
ncbi:uncharacterized protein PITG_19123 [Phytophthora infestans T30-4]|uniref:Phosphatidate phosphatase APP1 catalytic domain-containing protein n=1 Tax=Phytophthora infestans (strain T30-4) TaxID=403677 RepID=D0NYW3_PHYIT|nr:uncharacterized protein PITG_19123 [Phytophthora infestans T30-4]EEY68746.1 conserved hypothetical protein [Phytophthora infestans T30-4]|eukprot:XP_002997438.1 conserved hypothetical protein [Phytophthora infestans T30-4]